MSTPNPPTPPKPPTQPPSKPKPAPKPKAKKPTNRGRPRGWKRLAAFLWSWGVVGVVSGVLYGVGANATYGHDPTLASVLYFLAVLLVTVKFITWEEAKKTRYRGAITTIFVLLAVVLYGFSLKWALSKREIIRSHAHIDEFIPSPIQVGQPLFINVSYRNDGERPMKAMFFYLTKVEEGPSNHDELIKRQEELFNKMVNAVPSSFSPTTEVPVRATRYVTDNVGDPPQILDAYGFSKIVNSQWVIYFMGRITYRDSEGGDSDVSRHSDYCGIFQHGTIFLCEGHNNEP